MGFFKHIRNVFGLGDSQDPSRQPASTHHRRDVNPAPGGTPRIRRPVTGASQMPHPPTHTQPTVKMSASELYQHALTYHQRQDWALALPFWQHLQKTGAAVGDEIQLGLLICLLHLGRLDDARAVFGAPGAPAAVRLEAAHYFLAGGDFEQALPLWRTLAAETNAEELQAPAWQMRCLLELGRQEEARFVYRAADVPLQALSVAATNLEESRNWEAALKQWRRFGRGTPEEQAEGQAGQARCLLALRREPEALALAAAPTAPGEVLLATAEHFLEQAQHARALPWFERLAKAAPELLPDARRGELLCLLALDRDQEAREYLADPKLPVMALRAAAVYYHEQERWEEALAADRRVAEASADDRPAAEGFQVQCLLNLGRDAEARPLYADHEARPQCRRVAAEFFTARQRCAEALPLWETLSVHPDYRDIALKGQVYCLLNLGRTDAARALFTGTAPEIPALLGAANFYFNEKQYDTALGLWQTIAQGEPALTAAVAGKIVTCLLELDHETEARALFEPAEAALEAIVAAAHFYMFYDEGPPGRGSDLRTAQICTQALALWDRVVARGSEHRHTAQRQRLACLLELERFAEAEAVYRAPDADDQFLLDATLFFSLSQRWEQALPLLAEVATRNPAYAAQAAAFQVAGWLALGRRVEAAQRYDAPDAEPGIRLAAADFFREHGQYEAALSLYRRVAAKDPAGEPVSIGWQVDCLLALGREAEARPLYAGVAPPRQALVAAANFFMDAGRWADALACWQALANADAPASAAVQANIVACLLESDRAAEAAPLLATPELPREILSAALQIYHRTHAWAAGQALAERHLAANRPAVQQLAKRFQLLFLIRTGQLAAARAQYEQPDTPAPLLIASGHELIQGRHWAAALDLWRLHGERFAHRSHEAQGWVAYCLLALGRAAEAASLYAGEDATAAMLGLIASFFDSRRDYAAAAPLHRRLIAKEAGINPLLGYLKNRTAAGDWETLTGGLSDQLQAALEPHCRRNEPGATRQALWLPLVRGRFDEVLENALAVRRRVDLPWQVLRCFELQVIAAALVGSRKVFERALADYGKRAEYTDDRGTLPDIVRQLATRHHVTVAGAITAQLDTLQASAHIPDPSP